MAVEAQLEILKGKTRRGTARRAVTLRGKGAGTAGKATDVLIHNLSESGALLESATKLNVGERIVIDLPDLERVSAQVVWASDDLFGCAFDHPVPRAAVSAAQLRSAPGTNPGMSLATEAGDGPLAEPGEPFGARLKRLRKQSGLSLVEFARRVNVSRPTVWSWEASKSLPRESKVPALLDVLGVSERELYGAPAEPFERAAEPASVRVTELQGVIRDAKARVAEITGTSPDKIKLIIEV